MNSPLVKGWCPGALRPMMSGDGLVLRIRAPLGRLSQEQARGIADLSRSHGNGRIDLTSRANLQMRGVREAGHGALLDRLRDLDLLDADEAAEARRNIVLTPFWDDGDDSHAIAQALTHALARAEGLSLPGKFGFAVDCGPVPVLTATPADIRIERGAEGLICRADGADRGVPITRATAVEAALGLARWFLNSGGAPEGRGRMARHLAAGAILPGAHRSRAGILREGPPQPGPVAQGQLVALEFGQMAAETLAGLAEGGALRLTPWRMLLVEGEANLPDGITDPADPRLNVTACTGAPACPQALADTRPLARALAPHLPAGAHLHVSGCAKGCARPGPAPLTLLATGPRHFDLIRDGRASDPPAIRSMTARDLIANPDLLKDPS